MTSINNPKHGERDVAAVSETPRKCAEHVRRSRTAWPLVGLNFVYVVIFGSRQYRIRV